MTEILDETLNITQTLDDQDDQELHQFGIHSDNLSLSSQQTESIYNDPTPDDDSKPELSMEEFK